MDDYNERSFLIRNINRNVFCRNRNFKNITTIPFQNNNCNFIIIYDDLLTNGTNTTLKGTIDVVRWFVIG